MSDSIRVSVFAKHKDNYVKNSEAFKNAMVATVQAAVLLSQEEITNLKDKLAKLRHELNKVKAKVNIYEQYSRHSSIHIFGLNEEEG